MNLELRNFNEEDYYNIAYLSDDEWKLAHLSTARSMINATGNIERCIVAVDDSQIVGYIYGFALPNHALFPEFLYVIPAYRNKGIGKKLIEKLETSTNCTSSTIFYNKDLHDYYKKMGYTAGDALEVATKELSINEVTTE